MIPRTYPVTIKGVGDFTFRRRTFRDEVRISAEKLRILGGPSEDEALSAIARAIADLSVLTEAAPEGWDVDAVDPFDEDAVAAVFRVHGGLRDAEVSFRSGSEP